MNYLKFVLTLTCLFLTSGECFSYGQEVLPVSISSRGEKGVKEPVALALVPPMGWNTWNRFRCNVSEELIKQAADTIVSSGMKDAGYEYIVIDDCWQVGRDIDGNILHDADRFPNGMKALADFVHSKGLKFGIYTCAGTKTCKGRPGSRGYEYQDMRQYAQWDVDYVKVDWCFTGEGDAAQNARASYKLFSDAIKKSGRPMVLSICDWGVSKPWEWAEGIGQLWRTTYDIEDCWACGDENHLGWTKILDMQVGLEKYAGPGHWNDPDMLEVGNGNMSVEECRAHFSMWCILASPLIAGNDLNNMSVDTLEILTNPEVVAVDQDRLGKQGVKIRDEGDLEVWSKVLENGEQAIALLNRSNQATEISVSWKEVGLDQESNVAVRDLWKREDRGFFESGYSAQVPPHGIVLLRVIPGQVMKSALSDR